MPWENIQERKDARKAKNAYSAHFVIAKCNVGLDTMMNTYFSNWQDAWFLDIGASCHMSFS